MIYDELFRDDEFNWVDVDFDSLPDSTRSYLKQFLSGFNLKYHHPPINGEYVFLIDHPVVQYLIHDSVSESHMWGDVDFENLDNNYALAVLLAPTLGIEVHKAKKLFDTADELTRFFDSNFLFS